LFILENPLLHLKQFLLFLQTLLLFLHTVSLLLFILLRRHYRFNVRPRVPRGPRRLQPSGMDTPQESPDVFWCGGEFDANAILNGLGRHVGDLQVQDSLAEELGDGRKGMQLDVGPWILYPADDSTEELILRLSQPVR